MNVKVEGRFPSMSMYRTFWHHSPHPDHKSSIGSPLFHEPCVYPCSSVYFLKTAVSRLSLWSDSCRRHILVDVSISLHSTLQHLQGTFCHVFSTPDVLGNCDSYLIGFTLRDCNHCSTQPCVSLAKLCCYLWNP